MSILFEFLVNMNESEVQYNRPTVFRGDIYNEINRKLFSAMKLLTMINQGYFRKQENLVVIISRFNGDLVKIQCNNFMF